MVECQDFWRQCLSILTIVTHPDDRLVDSQPMFQQSILIAVETILGNLQLQRSPIEGDALASRLNQMSHGVIGPHIVIDHHATCIYSRTDTVVEHQGDTRIYQFLIVVIAFRVLCLRDNHPTDFIAMEVFTDSGLTLILLAAQGHHNPIATCCCRLLDTCQNRREIIVGKLRHYHADDPLGHHATMPERLTDGIRIKVVFTGILLDGTTPLLTNPGRVFQGTRHGGYGNTKFPCNILHCHRHFLFHPALIIHR